ncbi:DNA replication licensing factor MCM2 [Dictyocoela muelleri]|nr:DNA replication licensing factor MCM2 [Dictyocoela muelleri]
MSKRRINQSLYSDSETENLISTLNSQTIEYSESEITSEESYVEGNNVEEVANENFLETIDDELLEKDFYSQDIQNIFAKFLNTFKNKKYLQQIRKMCGFNQESLYVSYLDLYEFDPKLADLLSVKTEKVIKNFDKGAFKVVLALFPNYNMIKPEVHVRIIDVPVQESIRSLRNEHLNTLVKVNGVVTRRSGVFPLLAIVNYSCLKCRGVFGPFIVDRDDFKPSNCLLCQSRGPFVVNSSETKYKNYQKMTLQEVPGSVASGSLPRSKEVLLFYDLIDCAKPGEECEVTGIYKNCFSLTLNIKNGFPVFFTTIEALSVIKKESEYSETKLTDDDVKEIMKISRHPNIKNIVFNSIAPSIYGHERIKKAIALAIVGGIQKVSGNHTIRGDINVLLLGDPGTAKSQFLRYVEKISDRSVLATGQGASSVGLTAGVRKDPITHEWTLEGGALVLADRGICLIDEFDKMNDIDRTSIHEAMEQQSISISKAGIVASLHARCSVIAAANPLRGRYNSSLTFSQNINLSDPIISRFDILCVVRDVIDLDNDERTANFILESHSKSEEKLKQNKDEKENMINQISFNQEDKKFTNLDSFIKTEEKNFDPIKMRMSQNFLRKYLAYAKTITPTINIDLDRVTQLYTELRKETHSGIPITVRHVESIVRMSEAIARIRLSNVVSKDDVDTAIRIALDSFINAQKYSITKNLQKKFRKYLVDGENDLLLFILNEMVREKIKSYTNVPNRIILNSESFERRADGYGIKVMSSFYETKEFKSGYQIEGKKIVRSMI